MASLTIGSGELVFSSRAGAIFEFRLLGVFVLVLLLKWALVIGASHHWLTTDRHPLERWTTLPGPAGWLPITFLLLAITAFPVWVSFHAGTIGTLLSSLTHTTQSLNGSAPILWGIAALLSCLALSSTGGYARSERVQSVIVAVMLVTVLVSLVFLKPDLLAMLRGLLHLGPWHYPDWVAQLPEFSARPVWVEVANYAGVLGGGGYDYLAYVAWLREKHGERAREARSNPAAMRDLRRVIWVDCTLSFVMVLAFTGVFVACGAILLAPQHRVPSGTDLLTLQAQFVGGGVSWLQPLYFLGALLAMGGTLYGTIEVAPTLAREVLRARPLGSLAAGDPRVRQWSIRWCTLGALLLLMANALLVWRQPGGGGLKLVGLLTPANLFTGVTACGVICALNLWMDRRFGATLDRLPRWVQGLNLLSAIVFLGLGFKGYWELNGWLGLSVLGGTLAVGWLVAFQLKILVRPFDRVVKPR
ncbi:MAG: hypothetical protein JNN07_17560 [Verrucomicrobiales bacterium]|nr:hypothetical protein [Verrucomicrobiales bacterium]